MPARRGQTTSNAIERSQKTLYLAVKKELSLCEPAIKKEIAAYERSFRASLPKHVKASDRAKLLEAIAGARVVLVGDFHPFRQSQKGFIRLVEGSAARFTRPVIALECFLQAHQTAIQEYLGGLITADELRDKIDFERYWPFSWENYREILALARKRGMPVIALNIMGRSGKGSLLRARDAAAAERISKELSAHPGTAVFALYGELHLGRKHLPGELRTRLSHKIRVLTVHQNNTDLYWKAPTLRDGQKPEVLRLGPQEYCILNSVPWVKLRSYLDWLEGSSSPEMEGDELDVAGMVHHYTRLLADAAEITVSLDGSVDILPPDRLDSRAVLNRLRRLPSPDRELARHALHFHRTGYLPVEAALILPTVSTNSMSEAATHLLRHSLTGRPSGRWSSDEWMAHFMLGYVGSKILNPKRKCNEVQDLKRLADSRHADQAKVAARALALLKPFLKKDRLKATRKKLPEALEIEACRTAGFVMGERFFLAVLMQPALLKRLRLMFRRAAGRELLKETATRIAKLPVTAASKQEKF